MSVSVVPFPVQIDNTMRAAWKSCRRKFWLRFMLHWDGIGGPSIHLHAGQCFAKGLEVARKAFYEHGADEDLAIGFGYAALVQEWGDFQVLDPKATKTLDRMTAALVSYFDEYRLPFDSIKPFMAADGRPCVEFDFGLPLHIANPQSGEPIIYCGRFDMLGQMADQLWVVDEKTTGQLGPWWAKRYELSAQFTGYCYAAQQYGYPVVGAMIRGIGILKGEIRHAQMPFPRPQFMIEEWLRELTRDIQDMVNDWRALEHVDGWGAFAADLADACGSFGGCTFLPVCGIDPPVRDKMLEINFQKRVWTPLKGGEEE